MAFVGDPPLIRPEADEVHVSTAFTWDIPKAQRLAEAWEQYYPVKLGGPAFGSPVNGFEPGKYIKHGVTFTTRGCDNNCSWCLVPEREGKLRILDKIHPGHIIQDNNILQAGPGHFDRVICMLSNLGRAATFSGGLDARLITPAIVHSLRTIYIRELYLACDTLQSVKVVEKAAALLTPYFKRRQLRVYVLISPGDKGSLCRLERMWEIGLLPFAQLFQPEETLIKYNEDWRHLARTWSRPAAMFATHGAD